MPKKKRKTAKRKKKSSAKKRTRKKVTKKKVSTQPKGYNTITPYLIVDNAPAAINFYKKVFNAKEVMRMERQAGKIGHAELKIGDTKIMLADESPEMDARSPQMFGGTPVSIYLYVKDVDDVVDRAIAQGARLTRPVSDMFYGDRSGTLEDPYGHKWHVSTHIEDVSAATIRKRGEDLFGR